MKCNFSKRQSVSSVVVKVEDHIIPQVTYFKYRGSVVQNNREIGDVNHRIQVGWLKWRSVSGVLCDVKVPLKLKGKFYRTPSMLYMKKCWAVKNQHEHKLV